MTEYTIVNRRTGVPVHTELGDPMTFETLSRAQDAADHYTSGNEDDFKAKPLSEVDDA